ncbi:MAG: hypothetical protein H7A21_12260 [Spirochaetales bacterium]|nr:hypothetical protein [Leptospiraceae bacterium]MCP5482201.1 hypothetical protein [Spirochaetales bacterium]MCP5484687.1 hypothetical protein [Spirochaetales bacterium]
MAAQTQTIENGARDLLNAGLGLFKTVEESVNKFKADLEKSYNDLIKTGAGDTSEQAVTLRKYLDQGISAVRDAQGKVEGLVKS